MMMKYIKNITPLFSYKIVISRLLFKTLKIRIVLYECKTWCPTLSKEHKLYVCEENVFRKNICTSTVEANKQFMLLHDE